MTFRDPNDYKRFNKKTINCLITDGGIGDLLCYLMSVNHLHNNSKWLNLLVWVPDFLKDFAKHVLPSDLIIRNFTEAITKYDNTRTGISTKWHGIHTPTQSNAVEYGYHVLCNINPTLEQQSYLKIRPNEINIDKFNLPEKYVVIQGTFTEIVKTMPIDTFDKLKEYCKSKGYEVVILGKSLNKAYNNDESESGDVHSKIANYNFNNTINLINKCSLLETAAIISKAKLLLCMDGGLMHIGAFTNTPMVVGVTFVTKEQVGPIRDGVKNKDCYFVEPDESLGCRGCQSRLLLLYGHDFRECLYGPDDYTCVKQITFNKFKKQIESNNLL